LPGAGFEPVTSRSGSLPTRDHDDASRSTPVRAPCDSLRQGFSGRAAAPETESESRSPLLPPRGHRPRRPPLSSCAPISLQPPAHPVPPNRPALSTTPLHETSVPSLAQGRHWHGPSTRRRPPPGRIPASGLQVGLRAGSSAPRCDGLCVPAAGELRLQEDSAPRIGGRASAATSVADSSTQSGI
jgi:hypothetical protein